MSEQYRRPAAHDGERDRGAIRGERQATLRLRGDVHPRHSELVDERDGDFVEREKGEPRAQAGGVVPESGYGPQTPPPAGFDIFREENHFLGVLPRQVVNG